MSNIPQVSGKQVIKALEKVGFTVSRQKGSHIRLVRIQGGVKQLITVPNHKVIRKGTLLNGILKPSNLSLEEFNTNFVVVILGSVATPESNQLEILDKPE